VHASAGLQAPRFADDLEAVRRHFKLESLNTLSHSWGPAVVALYATRHPERLGRTILLDGIPIRMSEGERGPVCLSFPRQLRLPPGHGPGPGADPGDARRQGFIPVATAREWATTMPNARLFVMRGYGHFPYMEAPEPFFTAVHQFLNGRWPDRAELVRE
jgi:pimeloyl-ACP methyl ester carboxylesterase